MMSIGRKVSTILDNWRWFAQHLKQDVGCGHLSSQLLHQESSVPSLPRNHATLENRAFPLQARLLARWRDLGGSRRHFNVQEGPATVTPGSQREQLSTRHATAASDRDVGPAQDGSSWLASEGYKPHLPPKLLLIFVELRGVVNQLFVQGLVGSCLGATSGKEHPGKSLAFLCLRLEQLGLRLVVGHGRSRGLRSEHDEHHLVLAGNLVHSVDSTEENLLLWQLRLQPQRHLRAWSGQTIPTRKVVRHGHELLNLDLPRLQRSLFFEPGDATGRRGHRVENDAIGHLRGVFGNVPHRLEEVNGHRRGKIGHVHIHEHGTAVRA
mmetsp:Transcript_40620/g.107636  ORF Transcript_40620/g.107636 Transcript_40620/m.107636 type:complete len:323 (+) Transcript_40620:134-1102(+)